MSQIPTLCDGLLCRIRNDCKRYAPINEDTLAVYFFEAPWKIVHIKGMSLVVCEQQIKQETACTN